MADKKSKKRLDAADEAGCRVWAEGYAKEVSNTMAAVVQGITAAGMIAGVDEDQVMEDCAKSVLCTLEVALLHAVRMGRETGEIMEVLSDAVAADSDDNQTTTKEG